MIEVTVKSNGGTGTVFHGIYEEKEGSTKSIFILKLSRISFPHPTKPGETFQGDWRKVHGNRSKDVGPLPMVTDWAFIDEHRISKN
jgi:hypothetical protein